METFYNHLAGNKPVFVDFSAKWCGPCRVLEPIIDELSSTVNGKAEVVKVDVDMFPQLAEEFQIRSVPTLILFINQQPVWRQSGVFTAEYLAQIIDIHAPVIPFPSN